MRTDERTPRERDFDPSMTDPYAHVSEGFSLSGHERNVLFLNRRGEQFDDVSGVSGVNHPADGRSTALLDYDRDGWQDLVVVNANAPLLQLFRNEIGELPARAGTPSSVLALRFEGGNRSATASPELSPRDGYGAIAEVELPDATLVREHRAGEGFAAQNSATQLVGLGDVESVKALRVRWPSGRTQEIGPIAAGSQVTVYEDASHSPDGRGFRVEPYRAAGLAQAASHRAERRADPRRLEFTTKIDDEAPLRIVTTMATWCDNCKGELPQLAKLRETFAADQVALVAVPVDEDDDRAKLEAYEREYEPAYALLKDLSEPEIERVRRVVIDDLHIDALPAAIATDAEGRVLRTMWEVPSVSEVKALLSELTS